MRQRTTVRPFKRRNRTATTDRILQATATLFAENGVAEAGINAIAERAGCHKVLIYRYFAGWNGLVEAFVRQGFYLSFINEQGLEAIPADTTPSQQGNNWQDVLTRIAQELRDRPATCALIRWEIANQKTELAHRIAQLRNAAFGKLVSRLSPTTNCEGATSAIVALLWGGLAYLALSSEGQDVIIDVPIREQAGWQQIDQALCCLSRSFSE